MAGRRRSTDTPERPKDDGERTVLVAREDGEKFWVTPAVARAIERQGGEILSGAVPASANAEEAVAAATAPLAERITELEQAVADRDELLNLVPTDIVAELTALADATKE